MTCNKNHNPYKCGAMDGERLKADALALLESRREAYVRRAQRVLVYVLLQEGSATLDDVRALVELPPAIGPKCFGAVPPPLVRAGIIFRIGYTPTCRPVAHARPLSVWTLADRAKALRWLADHPELPDRLDKSEVAANSQGLLFDPQETATPAAGTVGAA